MKNILLIMILFVGIFASAQKHFLSNVPNKLPKNPPGTIKINDSIYIDKHPVTFMMYQEMLQAIRNGWGKEFFKWSDTMDSKRLKVIKVDSIKRTRLFEQLYPINWSNIDIAWGDRIGIDGFHLTRYNQPIDSVTKEQAWFYCNWRTNMLYLTQKNDKNKKEFTYKKFTYYLSKPKDLISAQRFFEKKKKLKTLKRQPENYDSSKLGSWFKKSKYYVFTNSKKELTSDSQLEDSGMFRCTCLVEKDPTKKS